jgi:WD40 repeat protein
MIVTGTYNGGIALWQLDEGSLSLIRVLQAPHGFAAAAAVTEIDFPSDGKLLASGGYEPQLCLWHVADGAPLHQLKPHGKYVTGITFAPDGATIASSDLAGKIRLWSVSEGALLQTLDAEKELTDLIYGTDGNQLLAAASDQSIQIWDVAPSQCVAALQTGLKHRIHMALSPNRRVLACASYHENNVQLWDVVQGRLLHTLQRHTAPIKTVAFSPDGRLLASGGDGGTVLIWGLE